MPVTQRDEIFEIIIKHVSDHGWSDEIVSLVNADIQKTSSTEKPVFSGVKDLISDFLERNDNLMLSSLEKVDINKLRIRQRIRKAVITRLLQIPKGVIKHTAKFLANPLNSDVALKSLANTCDKIWYWAGDESTDFNYYTKRILLGAVYTASFAYYLKEEECSTDDLSIFVENRIDNVLKLGDVKNKFKKVSDFLMKRV